MFTQPHPDLFVLASGTALRLPATRGRLIVETGRLWLTRGDGDELVSAGEAIAIEGDAVVESWDRGVTAALRWQAAPGPAQRFAAAARRGFARGFFAAAAGFALLARTAASIARRTQGCISAGESIASPGAAK
jgi:hypothetical protein